MYNTRVSPTQPGGPLYWVTHITTGAAWGCLVGRPLPAALLGFASHIPLDVVPHHDPDSDVGYVVDGILGVVAIYSLASSKTIRRLDPRRCALCGAIGSALPDVELLAKLFKKVDKKRYIFPTHNNTLPQMHTGLLSSAVSQAVLAFLSLVLAAAKVERELRRCEGSGEREG